MKIQLVDLNKELCDEWKDSFEGCEDVTIHNESIFELQTDCIVSPANSFGFMNGGLDLLISKKVGWIIQSRVQKRIYDDFNGELLVGQSFLIETDNDKIEYCLVAPTMRVPMLLTETVNVYLASKAIFKTLKENINKINSISISGLGTGVGQLSPKICASQMKKAYDEIWLGNIDFPLTWKEAQYKHLKLYTDKVFDLQHKPKN